jgi:hypothetical protein
MKKIKVIALKDRKAYTKPVGGILITTDKPVSVVLDAWIDNLINNQGDIVVYQEPVAEQQPKKQNSKVEPSTSTLDNNKIN